MPHLASGDGAGSLVTRYGFTGREYDSDTGLYYYRARCYDPQAGRFLAENPLGLDGGDINLYAYVGNNPVSFVDSTGDYIQVAAVLVPGKLSKTATANKTEKRELAGVPPSTSPPPRHRSRGGKSGRIIHAAAGRLD